MVAVTRWLAYLVAWVVLTAVTAGVSWFGIRTVLSAAAPKRTVATANGPGLADGAEPPGAGGAEQPGSPAATVPASRAPAPADVWTALPDGRGGTAYRRTFRLSGGDAVIMAEESGVRVLTTAAKPGYSVNVTRSGDGGVQVSFTADRKASRVYVRWWSGPYAEVTESTV
jgi:hypothetical protein